MKNKSIGIIGHGSFGKFLYKKLSEFPNLSLHVYDPSQNFQQFTLGELPQFDVLILAVPLSSYPLILDSIKISLHPTTTLLDVCSVKMKPKQLIAELLPDHHNVLLTHPLFGPRSAPDSIKDHTLIVCDKNISHAHEQILQFCSEVLELKIYNYSAEEHDKIMAEIHALTFFVAKGLAAIPISVPEFLTPSYKMILDMQKFSSQNSEELFQTIESGNPFAKEMRQKVIDSFIKIDKAVG